MAETAEMLCQKLISHFANIERTRKKSEKLFTNGKLTNRDVDFIYSGLYIEAVTSFERFIEDLFTFLLVENNVHPCRKVKAKVSFKTISIVKAILLGEKKYVEWFPYDKNTKIRAEKFFTYGLPFTGLDKFIDLNSVPSLDKKIINITEKIYIIRNVLAHKSAHSYNQFYRKFIQPTGGLRSKEKKPIGYLRGVHSSHPVIITRFEQIMSDVGYIAKLITSKKLK